jgi:hypothetical protein
MSKAAMKVLRNGSVVEVVEVDEPSPKCGPGRPRKQPTRKDRLVHQRADQQPAPPVEVQMEGVSSEAILAELIRTRNLVSAFHKAIAHKAANALARDNPRSAVAWLELLPPAERVDASGRTVSAQQARKRLYELVMNAVAADQIEKKIEEQREVERLRLEVAELRARLSEPSTLARTDQAVPQQGGALSSPAGSAPSPIDVPTSAILPPGENPDLPQNQRMGSYPDDAKRKPPVVIDATPAPARARETVSGEWDRSPSGRAWHEWRRTHGDDYYDVLL